MLAIAPTLHRGSLNGRKFHNFTPNLVYSVSVMPIEVNLEAQYLPISPPRKRWCVANNLDLNPAKFS